MSVLPPSTSSIPLSCAASTRFRPLLPFSPAGEFAGVVDALGEGVTGLVVGDRVMGYVSHGAAREKIAVAARGLAMIPAGVSDAAAAGLTVTYGTGLHGLKDRGCLKPGETVAVLGAAGGAGLAAVELAKLLGAKVIAVASTDDKLAACQASGADQIFNYATGDLKQGLRDLTGGRGVDIVYDCVGGAHTEAALRSIAWGGRLLVIGFAAGDIPKIPTNLLLLKNASLVGVFWGEHTKREPEAHAANMRQLLAWVGGWTHCAARAQDFPARRDCGRDPGAGRTARNRQSDHQDLSLAPLSARQGRTTRR